MYVWLGVSYDTLDVTNVTNDSFLATCGAKEYLFGEVCKPAASVIKVSDSLNEIFKNFVHFPRSQNIFCSLQLSRINSY